MNRRAFFAALAAIPTVAKWLKPKREPQLAPINFNSLKHWFTVDQYPSSLMTPEDRQFWHPYGAYTVTVVSGYFESGDSNA